MKCTIPEISWHNRDPVLSVDLQVKNQNDSFQRLATGGTDAHVVIWHIEIQQTGAASVEFAADLQRHQRAVNVVRFSPSGEFLASGDDESVIIIWKQKTDQDLPEMPTTDSEGNKEQWVGVKVLRGHVEDVYDLCWSPDSMNLISGSVDNSAILWDAQKGRNIGILKDHKGFVQGVAWDPLNKYVATLSSDRTCRIYNIKTKKIVSRVSKAQLPVPESSELHAKVVRLFHDDTLKSFFRRLCFSPDGQLLIVPSGIVENENSDKHGNATHIFTRRVLNKPSAFLPSNNQYTVAVRCCPVLFELRERESVFSLPYRLILAVATQKSILLYDTQQPEPFGIVSNIHYTRLTDLTWSQDGRMLIVSSTDGYCSIITFAEGELGQVYKSKENSSAESREEDAAANMPSTEEGRVIRTKEVNSDKSEAHENIIACADETKIKPLSEKNEPNEKFKTQEKTPEKIGISDKTDSPVISKEKESLAVSETPKRIKPVSATNSPNTSTNSPKSTASPFQKTPKRIKPILVSKSTKSPKSTEESPKKPEIHSKEVTMKTGDLQKHPAASIKSPVKADAKSSEVPEKKINEDRKDAPGNSEVKLVPEKMEVDKVLQRTTDSSTAIKTPSRIGTKSNTSTPRRVQLITLSTSVSSKTNSETKKATRNSSSLVSVHDISSEEKTAVSEKMEIDLCDAQKHDSHSVEKNSKQQESGKRTPRESKSEKETTNPSNQIKEVQADTECMETDELANLPKGEVDNEEMFKNQHNSVEKNSKQQESGKQTHQESKSEKETTSHSNQIKEVQADTECMETDELANLPKGEVDNEEMFKNQHNSVEKNSKQQESGKQTHQESKSEKETTSHSNQIKEVQADTECMETDEFANLPKGEVDNEEMFKNQHNTCKDKHSSETELLEGKSEQTSEKITVDSEKSNVDKSAEASFKDSSPCKKEENVIQKTKSSDEQLQGNSSTPHRTAAISLTPSNVNTSPNSPLRNAQSCNVTPGREKRTPRRVQLITLSSPKSKKKLL